MKKKQSIREQREAKKAAQKQRFSAERTARAESVQQEAAAQVTDSAQVASKTDSVPIKSRNKAAGLKATFVSGSTLYLTSFGKGNAAVPEHQVRTDAGYQVTPLRDSGILKVRGADDTAVSFSGARVFAEPDILRADNPLHTTADQAAQRAGQDILGLKDKLEHRYYGRNFDDNLHIQIIYNILDIEKILAVYVANAAAALTHLAGDTLGEEEDFIGYMSTLNTYAVFMDPSLNPELDQKKVDNINRSRSNYEELLKTKRLGYFGLEYDPRSDQGEAQKERIYHLMALIGQLRQWSFHGISKRTSLWLYQLEQQLAPEYIDTLNFYFDRRFKEISKGFLKMNKVNLLILLESYPQAGAKELAKLYYDFIVYKSQKNLGFSIKTLREMMLDRAEAAEFKAQELDSDRSRLYKLLDFCLFYDYMQHPERIEQIVGKLRTCMTESEKEQVYSREATEKWNQYRTVFRQMKQKRSGQSIEAYQSKPLPCAVSEAFTEHETSVNASCFAKLMYVLCMFLDGKEINDLLTTLLNKFDNIAALTACAEELGIGAQFVSDYAFFEQCPQHVRDINLVRNIARMTKPSGDVKKTMFRDALDILGIPAGMEETALEQRIDEALKPGKEVKHDFRNFIINNVIESSRFIYVIKFCNPKNVRKIVMNQAIVQFVLKQIPETQITRYYLSCIKDASDTCSIQKKIGKLSEMMTRIDFGSFTNVSQRSKDKEKQLEKERFKAIVRLYLTVIYLVVKNLVNINARYIMAFHCLERDARLYRVQFGDPKDYLALADTLCREGDASRSGYLARNRRMRECVAQDIQNARALLVKKYRNAVAHLNVIRSCDKWIDRITSIRSYYAMYQYLVQSHVAEGVDPARPDYAERFPYYAALHQYNCYVKDFVKALNAPFGYNIPRFKNLTIEALFDRNIHIETDE